MKLFKLILAALALQSLAVSGLAQQPAAPGAQKPAIPATLPKGKVAVVNTAMFQQQVEEFKQKIGG